MTAMVSNWSTGRPAHARRAWPSGDCTEARRTRRSWSWRIRKRAQPLQSLQTPSKRTTDSPGVRSGAVVGRFIEVGMGGRSGSWVSIIALEAVVRE